MALSEQQKAYREKIEKWERFLGIPRTEPERTEIDFILNVRKEEIKNIDSVQLSEYSLMLYQYAFFLQQKSNECETFLKFSASISRVIEGDDIAKLASMTREIDMRLSRIMYLARRIEMVAQGLTNINRARYNGVR